MLNICTFFIVSSLVFYCCQQVSDYIPMQIVHSFIIVGRDLVNEGIFDIFLLLMVVLMPFVLLVYTRLLSHGCDIMR